VKFERTLLEVNVKASMQASMGVSKIINLNLVVRNGSKREEESCALPTKLHVILLPAFW
jgi:hypothetical protein